DICGNVDSSCVQMIAVIDTIDPKSETKHNNTTLESHATVDTSELGFPTWMEECSLSEVDTVYWRDDSTGFDGTCMNDTLGVIARKFFAEDICGNVDSSCVQMIAVIDTVAPELENGCPEDTLIDCGTSTDPNLLGMPSHFDACSISSVDSTWFRDDSTGFDGTCTPDRIVGTITRTFFAADLCGNVDSSCVQIITVQDTLFDVMATASPMEVCLGDSTTLSYIILNATTATVEWYVADTTGGDCRAGTLIGTDSSIVVTPDTTTTYIVLVTNEKGCVDSSCVTVIVNPLPVCDIAGPDVVARNQMGIVYKATPGLTAYSWSIISGNATIVGPIDEDSVVVDADTVNFTIQVV
ncbi:MAG: hypothetical protein R3330_19030, partial [Saprospiraceae bacterium]|nr:hypothetical protein [Saprospiraceae bacterium]